MIIITVALADVHRAGRALEWGVGGPAGVPGRVPPLLRLGGRGPQPGGLGLPRGPAAVHEPGPLLHPQADELPPGVQHLPVPGAAAPGGGGQPVPAPGHHHQEGPGQVPCQAGQGGPGGDLPHERA